jgi:glycosyltransferase involved in cell wall biosynthesis
VRIVHVSTHDVWGGAALAAHRLHTGLRYIGQESMMFVAHREGGGQDVLRFLPPTDFGSRLARTLRRKSMARSLSRYARSRAAIAELFSDDRSQHGDAPLRQIPTCEILNFHWISEFLDSASMFRQTPSRTRIVWTLHDMNAFTGGCHYDAGCQKHRSNCGACPQLGATQEKDLSRQIWNRRQSAYSSLAPSQLQLVAPSRWMASEIQQSALLGRFPVTVIPNGVDLDAFAPRNRVFARGVLGLPQEAKVLLFAGHTLDERRKGFSVLLEALAGLREEQNLHLLSVGGYSLLPQLGIPYHPLGYVSTDRLLSVVYSAADLCVVPTLQDNLPNITIESLACGTPVVGFNVGGMADVVSSGHTGVLVPSGSPQALQESIRLALANSEALTEMRAHCRQTAIEKFSIHRQARNYLELYKSLTGLV